jgi:hypothetical protein
MTKKVPPAPMRAATIVAIGANPVCFPSDPVCEVVGGELEEIEDVDVGGAVVVTATAASVGVYQSGAIINQVAIAKIIGTNLPPV